MADQQAAGIPPWLNTVMRFILRSPLHFLVSDKIMLVTFKGRKSGKTYTTPVSYMQSEDTVTLFTHASWWRNLTGGAPVTLRIKGKTLHGTTKAIVSDQNLVAEGLSAHLLRNHFDAKYYNVGYDADGSPNAADVRRGAEGVVMVRFARA